MTVKLGTKSAQARALQRAVNVRLATRRPSARIAEDGEWGRQSKAACALAAYLLGVLYKSNVSRGQAIVLDPLDRTAHELKRAKRRMAAERKLRTAEREAAYLRERAWTEAGRHVGTMESGGNNRGAAVEALIRSGGGVAGQAWCGWFVAHCYRMAGSRAITWQWGAVRLYLPLAGLAKTSEPKRGDIVRFTFDHVGLFGGWCDASGRAVSKARATHVRTREGNTGAAGAVSDSASGGDGVYEKVRSRGLVRDFIAVSR